MNGKTLLFFAVVVLIVLYPLIGQACCEVDQTSTVTNIVDGDTFDIAAGERIRLADVDAPEYYESGYFQATDYLASLIDGEMVYLDVDDVYTYDYSGTGNRLVCVAYVDYNSTHLLNVNKALLESGHAVIDDFYNEFNPNLWTLYSLKSAATSTPTPEPTASPEPTPTSSPSPTDSPSPVPTTTQTLPQSHPYGLPEFFYVAIVILILFLVIFGISYFMKKQQIFR